jgi:hypothetical protein
MLMKIEFNDLMAIIKDGNHTAWDRKTALQLQRLTDGSPMNHHGNLKPKKPWGAVFFLRGR